MKKNHVAQRSCEQNPKFNQRERLKRNHLSDANLWLRSVMCRTKLQGFKNRGFAESE